MKKIISILLGIVIIISMAGCSNLEKTDDEIIEMVQSSYFDSYPDYKVIEYTKALQAAYSDDAGVGEKWAVYSNLSEMPERINEFEIFDETDFKDKKVIEYKYTFFVDDAMLCFILYWTYDGQAIQYKTMFAMNTLDTIPETIEFKLDAFLEFIESSYNGNIPHLED